MRVKKVMVPQWIVVSDNGTRLSRWHDTKKDAKVTLDMLQEHDKESKDGTELS